MRAITWFASSPTTVRLSPMISTSRFVVPPVSKMRHQIELRQRGTHAGNAQICWRSVGNHLLRGTRAIVLQMDGGRVPQTESRVTVSPRVAPVPTEV